MKHTSAAQQRSTVWFSLKSSQLGNSSETSPPDFTVGLTNGAVGAVGVGCTVAWAAKMHALSLVLSGFGYEIAPAARCFCFLNRGPGPSEAASQRPLTE